MSVIVIIQEKIFEWIPGIKLLPKLLNGGNDAHRVVCFDLDGRVSGICRLIEEHKRLEILFERFLVIIGHNTDN
jgi:hypothetical protein